MSVCNESKPYIFISYSHRDTAQVYPIIQHMMEAGYNIWYDEGIDPGTEWDENIAKHVKGCSYFIAFISNNYIGSKNCKDELNFSRDEDKNQLLLYLEEVNLPDGMAMRMNRIQAIYWNRYTDKQDAYQKLFSAKDIHVTNMNLVLPEGQTAPNPTPVAIPSTLRSTPQQASTPAPVAEKPKKNIPVGKILTGVFAVFGGFMLFCIVISLLSGGSSSDKEPSKEVVVESSVPQSSEVVKAEPSSEALPVATEKPSESSETPSEAEEDSDPIEAGDYDLACPHGTVTVHVDDIYTDIEMEDLQMVMLSGYSLKETNSYGYSQIVFEFRLADGVTTDCSDFYSTYRCYKEDKDLTYGDQFVLETEDGQPFRPEEIYEATIIVPTDAAYVKIFSNEGTDRIDYEFVTSPFEGDESIQLSLPGSIGSRGDSSFRASITYADAISISESAEEDSYRIKLKLTFLENPNNAVYFGARFDCYDRDGYLITDFTKVFINLYAEGYDKENKDASNAIPYKAGDTVTITLGLPRNVASIRFNENTVDGFDFGITAKK